MLRSKYADPKTPTFVELEFEVGGKRYTVRRNPEYLRPKTRGEGFTTEKADATLTYGDGRPPVTRAKEVTAAVIDVIGLDYNQFSQIVLIAQGQFTRLLNASTEERIKIFRTLFRTQRYQQLQEKLQAECSDLNQQRTAQNIQIGQILSSVHWAEDDPEAETLAALSAQTPPDAVVERLTQLTERQDAALSAAADARNKADERLAALQQTLGRAAAAQKLREDLAAKQNELAGLLPARDAARTEMERHAGDAAALDALTGQIANAETDLARYDKLEELLRQETEARGKARQEQSKAQTHREALATLDKTLAALREEQDDLANAEAERVKLETQSKELTQRGKALPLAHIKQRRNAIGNNQRRDHHCEDDASRQRGAENAHRQIGGEKNKGKTERPPGGMETKNGDRQLDQIVAGGDHQQMEKRKPEQRFYAL